MGHIQQFETDFRARHQAGDVEELVAWVKAQILQSYRNGLAARGQNGEEAKRAAWNLHKHAGQPSPKKP